MYILTIKSHGKNTVFQTYFLSNLHGIRAISKRSIIIVERNCELCQNKKLQQQVTLASPYFLSHSDNPGVSITPVTLTGEHYAEWASELENALRAKRKIGFINGTLLMPDEQEKPAKV